MPFGTLEGIGLGCKAYIQDKQPVVFPSEKWLGRVINALAKPIDGLGSLQMGALPSRWRTRLRWRMRGKGSVKKLDMGVRAVNSFTTLCKRSAYGDFLRGLALVNLFFIHDG